MKLSRMFKKLSAKKLAAAATVALAFAFPAASLAAQTVKLEGATGVANVTRGDHTYVHSVNASYDEVVKVEVAYHNTELPDSGKVANNLTVKINIPTGAGKTQTITSRTSSDNSNTINGSAVVNLDRADAYLQYIPGSAVWKHNIATNANPNYVETKISDAVVTSGAGLRLENEKPCYNFAATVTVLARVRVPGVTVTKQVEKAGESNKWAKSNTANPGDRLKYLISYKNTGNTVQNQVILRDNLPAHMTLVPGTTKLANATNPNGVVVQDLVNKGGINAGNFGAGANAFLTFEVQLDGADKFPCGQTTLTNVGIARPSGMNEYYDTATTTVNKVCANVPVYRCDSFGVVGGNNRTVTVNNFNVTATNGATFKHVVINWGDNTEALTTDSAVGKTHQYAADGTYTITAVAHFTVNGQDVTAAGCSDSVKFVSNTVVPETPGKLVDTGAGDILGLFAAVTAGGALAHRYVWARRNNS